MKKIVCDVCSCESTKGEEDNFFYRIYVETADYKEVLHHDLCENCLKGQSVLKLGHNEDLDAEIVKRLYEKE